MTSISYNFRVGLSTVSTIIYETCMALWETLKDIYLRCPSTTEFKEISRQFRSLWNMPNCTGAMDGKHIPVQAFDGSGSQYYNYKGFHSIVLLAICDAANKFLLVDVGAHRRNADSGIFSHSAIGEGLRSGTISFPNKQALSPEKPCKLPHFIVADEAFPLKQYIMRPYPERKNGALPPERHIFNYRLSRARRCIENAFGIMASRFRIFRRPILASEKTVNAIVLASVVLHNYLKSFDDKVPASSRMYCPPEFADHEDANGNLANGHWRNDENCFADIETEAAEHDDLPAVEVREVLAEHFMNEGRVPWQEERVIIGF